MRPILSTARTKTTVTLSDGQTSWEFDRANVRRLIAQLVAHEAKLEDEAPALVRSCPRAVPGKVVAP